MKNAAKTLGLGLEEESSFDWRIMLQFGELYFDFSGFIKIVHGIVLCCVLRSKHDFNEVAPGVIKIYQLTLITKSSSPDSDTPRNIVNQPCLSCACSRLSPGLILYSAMLLHAGLLDVLLTAAKGGGGGASVVAFESPVLMWPRSSKNILYRMFHSVTL